MGALLSRYEPISINFFQSINAMFFIAITAFVAAGFILWKAKSMAYNYRTLVAMLFFFMGTIALGNGFFMKMTRGPIATFEIYERGVVTGVGTYEFKSFRDAYLYTEEQASLINPQAIQQRLKVLVIELENEERINFTEENYPVEAILADIQEAYAQFREK
ncbi:MAG TPA: hypothetical protein VJ953_08485 [Saprospiraceae bacterium]|nr:hypothetical protein [Saprospiraceae bacterium]